MESTKITMRVYLSGPITGKTDYMERFAETEAQLHGLGFEVVNPAKVCAALPESFTHEDYMHVCFALIDLCDRIYLMNGWDQSDGATREAAYASAMNVRVMTGTDILKAKREIRI